MPPPKTPSKHALVSRVALLVAALAALPHVAFWAARTTAYDAAFVRLGALFASVLLWRCPAVPDPAPTDPAYDYASVTLDNWAAHPALVDWADTVPHDSGVSDDQDAAEADAFFIYPTGWFGLRWNAPVRAPALTDPLGAVHDLLASSTASVHASVFSNAARVYVPRYRQMTGWGFMMRDAGAEAQRQVRRAMDVAYADVERAFDEFLETRGSSERPIILAAHSQGSVLGAQLLRRRFSGTAPAAVALRERLAAAYLVGAALHAGDAGPDIAVCERAAQTGCFVTYNAVEEGGDDSAFIMRHFLKEELAPAAPLVCVNPLTWDAREPLAPADANPGSRPFTRPERVAAALLEVALGWAPVLNLMSPLEQGVFGARCDEKGLLRFNATSARGFASTGVFPGRNWHGGESSLYWLSTRRNARVRVEAALRRLR